MNEDIKSILNKIDKILDESCLVSEKYTMEDLKEQLFVLRLLLEFRGKEEKVPISL